MINGGAVVMPLGGGSVEVGGDGAHLVEVGGKVPVDQKELGVQGEDL